MNLDGRGLLLRYIATYVSKFSNSSFSELLDDTGSTGYGMAVRLISGLHPGEPEQWLTLAMQMFPQFFLGGTMVNFHPPWPGKPQKPAQIELYQSCPWRSEEMTLLEWLRKTNQKGEIVRWVRKRHAEAESQQTLEEFANDCQCRGEKCIGAEMYSIFNDKHFGQWMALNLPFRDLDDFLLPAIAEKVPDKYVLRACALELAPEVWANEEAMRKELQQLACREDFLQNALAMLRSQRHIIQLYLTGKLSKDEEEPPEPSMVPPARQVEEDAPPRNPKQQKLEHAINKTVDKALELRAARDEEVRDKLATDMAETNRILICTGPPGCGKSFVADLCIHRAKIAGACICYALPTGQLAAKARGKHTNFEIDACHGAFLFHRPLTESIALLSLYQLCVVDEIFQLTVEHFERLRAMFQAAGRQLCLVLLGDPMQLPNVEGEPPDSSALWKFCHKITLTQVHRCDDPVLAKKLAALRMNSQTGRAGKDFVAHLCRGHKAWSGHDEPTSLDVKTVLVVHPDTTFITCTRRGAAVINQHAVQILFEEKDIGPLTDIPADYEDNAENFNDQSKLRQDQAPIPNRIQVYRGLRVVLTKNLDKQNHFVNGMSCRVISYDPDSKAIIVAMQTKQKLAIYPYTDKNVPVKPIVYYPLRLGYAGTVYKFQGAELPHVTVWLDREGVRAAAYVAISRVRRDEDYLLGGIVTERHLVPGR